MRTDHRIVAILAICQMLFGASRALLIATAPLIAYSIAEHKGLATLPHSLILVGTALFTIPASMVMRRTGRRPGFLVGIGIGILGGVVCVYAIMNASFWLFALGTLLYGFFAAFGQFYRFAATDVAQDDFKPKAISLVLAGGVVAGFLGPEMAKFGKDLISSTPFLGAYFFLIGTMFLSALALIFLNIPQPSKAEREGPTRPLGEILRQPAFIAAALSATIAQAVMNFLMTATPIAMQQFDHQFADIAFVIEWHVVAMFAPGFFTGSLIQRFGEIPIIMIGLTLELGSILFALSGTDVFEFWASMAILGLGWNFAFTGATSLMTKVYTPAERSKTQGAMNFIIYGFVACVSLSSGAVIHYFSWAWLNIVALPLLSIAVISTLWYAMKVGATPVDIRK
jgi:MFS family permease